MLQIDRGGSIITIPETDKRILYRAATAAAAAAAGGKNRARIMSDSTNTGKELTRLPPDYEPGPRDVCLGSFERIHIGNRAFRTLMQSQAPAYWKAPHKPTAVKRIFEDLRHQGWRFLKQKRDEHSYKLFWCEIDDIRARSKITRSLRSCRKQVDKKTRVPPPPKPLPKGLRMPTPPSLSNSEEDKAASADAPGNRTLAAADVSLPSTREAASMPSAVSDHHRSVFSIPDGLLPRCARQFGWTTEFSQRILMAYRQFMELKRQHEDWNATVLSPPRLVDQDVARAHS